MVGFIYSSGFWTHCMLIYLSCTALTADHQGLVHGLQLALNIPVGLLCHDKDMWFELLWQKQTHSLKWFLTEDGPQHTGPCCWHTPVKKAKSYNTYAEGGWIPATDSCERGNTCGLGAQWYSLITSSEYRSGIGWKGLRATKVHPAWV